MGPYGEFGRPACRRPTPGRTSRSSCSGRSARRCGTATARCSRSTGATRASRTLPDFRERRMRGLNALRASGTWATTASTRDARHRAAVRRAGARHLRRCLLDHAAGDHQRRHRGAAEPEPGRHGLRGGDFVAETLVALIESNPTAYDGNSVLPRVSWEHGRRGALRGRAGGRDVVHGEPARRRRLPHHDPFAGALLVKNARLQLIANGSSARSSPARR
jgi:hypothetical protein